MISRVTRSASLTKPSPSSSTSYPLAARLFSRPDGSTSLVGFNFANSVDNETIRLAAEVRRAAPRAEVSLA